MRRRKRKNLRVLSVAAALSLSLLSSAPAAAEDPAQDLPENVQVSEDGEAFFTGDYLAYSWDSAIYETTFDTEFPALYRSGENGTYGFNVISAMDGLPDDLKDYTESSIQTYFAEMPEDTSIEFLEERPDQFAELSRYTFVGTNVYYSLDDQAMLSHVYGITDDEHTIVAALTFSGSPDAVKSVSEKSSEGAEQFLIEENLQDVLSSVYLLGSQWYSVGVNHGSGSGSYRPGERVAITAEEFEGFYLLGWASDSAEVVFDNELDASTFFYMPEGDVTITAVYEKGIRSDLIVKGGEGSGSYKSGSEVFIKADDPAEGKRFAGWEITSGNVEPADAASPETSFIMPEESVSIEARYEDIVFEVSVQDAEGSGTYRPGDLVTVRALEPEIWEQFKGWNVLEGSAALSDPKSLETTFIMPEENVAVAPVYATRLFMVSVRGGEGSGQYKPGDFVSIKADEREDLIFAGWTANKPMVVFEDPSSLETGFVMPECSVIVSPSFEAIPEYAVTVENGTGSGSYREGVSVELTANESEDGREFETWEVLEGEADLADPEQAQTTFIMPAGDVKISALYKDPVFEAVILDGSGSGSYKAGDLVTIQAAGLEEGEEFKGWKVLEGTAVFSDVKAPETFFIMPAENVTVQPVYAARRFMVSVRGGEGSGQYKPGDMVTVRTDPREGLIFAGWTANKPMVVFEDPSSLETSFIMPEYSVMVSASFGAVPEYTVTVENGTGSGFYQEGAPVELTANESEDGREFEAWEVLEGEADLADPEQAQTTFIMPAGDVKISVRYKEPAFEAVVLDGSGSGTYKAGDLVTIQAAGPEEGEEFKGWKVLEGTAVFSDVKAQETVFIMPAENVTVQPVYAARRFMVSVRGGEGSGQYKPGDIVSVKTMAAEGAAFAGWTANKPMVGFADPGALETSFVMPECSVIVTASFEIIPEYVLSVENGSGSGSYHEGDPVELIADAPEEGKVFDKWEVQEGTVDLADPAQAQTVFIMPASDVKISAIYKDLTYEAVILDGSGEGSYRPGETVTIKANKREGNRFIQWQSDRLEVEFADAGSEETTFIMPGSSITVTALYEGIEKYFAVIELGSGTGSYEAGEKVVIKADEPEDGMVFTGWEVREGAAVLTDMGAEETDFMMPEETVKIRAKYQEAHGTVTVAGGSGSGSYPAGTLVSIKADPAPEGKAFSNWSTENENVILADAYAESTAFIMPSGSVLISAVYADREYQATVDGGTGTGLYLAGTAVSVQAEEREGYRFASWQADDPAVVFDNAANPTAVFTMPTGDVNIKAVYDEIIKYEAVIEKGSGSGLYEAGERVAITADAPEPGTVFSGWEVFTGTVVMADPVETPSTFFIMPAEPVHMRAGYLAIPYDVVIEGGSGGGSYTPGTAVTIQADPAAEGMYFAGWSVTAGEAALENAFSPTTTFIMPEGTVNVKALYEVTKYTVTVAGGSGSGSYAPGETVTIQADTAPENHVFAGWTITGGEADLSDPAAETAVLTMRSSDVSIQALFQEKSLVSGTYFIVPFSAPETAVTDDRVSVYTDTMGDYLSQKFYITEGDHHQYIITSAFSGNGLSARANLTGLTLSYAEGDTYYILLEDSQAFANGEGSGAAFTSFTGDDSQKWYFRPAEVTAVEKVLTDTAGVPVRLLNRQAEGLEAGIRTDSMAEGAVLQMHTPGEWSSDFFRIFIDKYDRAVIMNELSMKQVAVDVNNFACVIERIGNPTYTWLLEDAGDGYFYLRTSDGLYLGRDPDEGDFLEVSEMGDPAGFQWKFGQ